MGLFDDPAGGPVRTCLAIDNGTASGWAIVKGYQLLDFDPDLEIGTREHLTAA